MPELKYSLACYPDLSELMDLTKADVCCADIYTYIKLHPELPEDGRIWIGKNDAGSTEEIIYADGSYILYKYTDVKASAVIVPGKDASLFAGPNDPEHLNIMVYEGGMPASFDGIRTLSGKEIAGVFALMGESDTLPEDSERKYVEAVRAVNHSLARYVGIYDGERLVSCGAITAVNEKYALLGNIYTKKSYRNRGLATKTVSLLTANALKSGLIPVLFCEDKNLNFYKNIGFRECTQVKYNFEV